MDSARLTLQGTGVVSPADAWAETGEGKRQRVGQAKTESGQPIWAIEILRPELSFGRLSTAVEQVAVPGGAEPPVVQPMTPIAFRGLVVTVNARRNGGLSVRWEAEAIDLPAAQGNRRNASD